LGQGLKITFALVLVCAQVAFAQNSSHSISADLLPPSTRPFSGSWFVGTGVQTFSEGKDNGTAGVARIGGALLWRLSDWARMNFSGDARFFAGRVQARYEDDIFESGLRLREGYFSVGARDQWEINQGVLSQEILHNELLISRRRSFPGLQQKIKGRVGSLEAAVITQQLIPTSYSMNTRRADQEAFPNLFTETVELKYLGDQGWGVGGSLSHYRFENLPSVVAFDSAALGNTVLGDVPASSQFAHRFEGVIGGLEGSAFSKGPFVLRAGGQWIYNLRAPDQYNRGQRLFIALEVSKIPGVVVTPLLSTYFNESDTSPAAYNRWDWGHNNRKGILADLTIEFEKARVKLQLKYIRADLINNDPFQSKKECFLLELETNDASF
jgi:hypothetical protein